MTNGNGKQNLVKPHILLIGLVLVAFNSYWCLMGTEVWHSTQLTIASLFFNAVFTLLVFCACQSTVPAIPAAAGDVSSGFTNHLRDGGDVDNDQRAHDDGVPHPCPRAHLSIRIARKRVDSAFSGIIFRRGWLSKAHESWTDSTTEIPRSTPLLP